MSGGIPDGSSRRMLSRITDAVVELDEDLRCVYANTEADALLGPEASDIHGCHLWDVSPGEATALRTKIEYAADSGVQTQIEQRDEATDRRLTFHIYPGDDGVTVLVVTDTGFVEQPTVPSRLDPSLGQATDGQHSMSREQLLENIFEHIPIHMFAKDLEARHEWVSGALVDDPSELLGKRDTELDSMKTAPFSEEALADDWRVLEDGVQILDKEEYNEQLDKWFLTSKVPCRDEDGNVVGLLGYSFEITERKARERSLTELQRQTQRLMETSTVEQTAEVAVHAARDALDAPLCGAYRVDEAEQTLSPVASIESFPEDFGGAPTYSRNHSGDRAAEIVWDTFDDGAKREIDTVQSVDGLAEQTPAESALLYPLGDRGIFIVSALEPRAFDDVQKRYFELLALSLQTAFERVEREQQQQRRASQLRTLHEYSRRLTSAENYSEVGRIVLEAVDDLTQLDGAGVHLIDDYEERMRGLGASVQARATDGQTDGARELVPIVAKHPAGEAGADVPTLGPESIAWDVYQSQTEYWTGNVRTDDRRYAEDTDVRSEGIVPLGEFGVLIVGSLSVDEFDELDQSVCRVLATNLAVALDQVHNQLELEQSRDLLSRTEQLADAGGWLYDTETETLQWTDGTRAIHEVPSGYDPTAEDAIEFYHPDDRERVNELFSSCVETGESYQEQLRIVTAEETIKWVQTQGEAVTSGEQIVGVRGTLRDITDRRARARQLERQRDNLEILNEMVRHDVRNNLAVIGGYTDTLGNHVDETGQEYVKIIEEQVQKATELTESARDLAAVLLQGEPDLERISIQSVLEEEIESIRSSFEDAVVVVDDNMPTEAVLANEMLGSVFRNLLKNAIQHNDEQVPKVTISGRETDGTVEIRVADNGPGIPDDIKDSVFEEGKKGLDSGGSGIGLYLVDSLVTEFDGDVRVEDNDPKGTVFVLHLPAADEIFEAD